MITLPQPKFSMGILVITPGASEALQESNQTPLQFLARHVQGDWGDCDADDQQANDDAILQDERLLSVYKTSKGTKVWIITEADRSSTCVLLPSEY